MILNKFGAIAAQVRGQTYILDTITSSVAAYSLRQLKTGVTYALRVRRSSDDTEQDIGFSDGYLDVTALITFVGEGSGYISKWYDQSGNGNDLSQTTTDNQPRIVNSGVIDEDGLYFDGSNYRLDAADSNSLDITGDMTVNIVFKKTTSNLSRRFIAREGTGGFLFGLTTSNYLIFTIPSVVDITSDVLIADNDMHIATMTRDYAATSTYNFYQDNGVANPETNAGAMQATVSGFYVGMRGTSADRFTGYIHEVIVFNTNLDDSTDRSTLVANQLSYLAEDMPLPVLTAVSDPTDIANLALWLDAEDSATTDTDLLVPCSADGQAVAGWVDKSSAGNSVIQSTAGNRPIYKTNQINGKPAIRFDESLNQYLGKALHTISPIAPATIIVVSKQSQDTNEGTIITWEAESDIGYALKNKTGLYNMDFGVLGVEDCINQISCFSPNEFGITSWKWDTSHNIYFYSNSLYKGYDTASQDTNSGSAAFRIGSSGAANDAFGGDIAEIIIYNALLSDIDKKKVELYLANKYNINMLPYFPLYSYLNADDYLDIPTYDGSGETVHPDVLDFGESGWNGYRYWMAITPYPSGDASYENPSILSSNDGETWVVPDGLTNPIDPAPVVGYNSDPCLVYDLSESKLWCIYRETDDVTTDYIRGKYSTDGVNWSSEYELFSDTFNNALSPSVIWDGSQFVMWTSTTFTLEKRTCVTITGTWSAPTECTIVNPADQSLKHICVRLYSGVYYMTTMDNSNTVTGNRGAYLAKSVDGDAWEYDLTFRIYPLSGNWDSSEIYRSTFTKNSNTLTIWYSAISGGIWRTGKTEFSLQYN